MFQIKLGTEINIRVSVKIQEKYVREKYYIWNPATWGYENDRHAESIIGNSVIICNDIIKTTKSTLAKTVPAKSIPINFNEKKLICKFNGFFILLVFFLLPCRY